MYPIAVFVALFLGAAAQAADIDACAKGCVTNIYADPSRLACKSQDMDCICHDQPNLSYGIQDCITQACALSGDELSAQIAAAQSYNNQQCTPFVGQLTIAALTSTDLATTATQATTTKSAETTAETITSPAAKSHPAAATPTSGVTTSAGTAKASDASKTSSSSSSATATLDSSKTSSTASSDAGTTQGGSSSGGLSIAAKAGIGAGAGVAVVGVAVIALCMVMKRKKNKGPVSPTHDRENSPPRPARSPAVMEISRPLPGSGRITADDVERGDQMFPSPPSSKSSKAPSHSSPKSTYAPSRPSREDDEVDLRARRYEDMLPRTQPRTLI